MKAIVQQGFGSPDVLTMREIERPVPGEDQVLVRVIAASVNASDWHLTSGLPRLIGRLISRSPGRVRGFDLAGRVETVGSRVTRFRPADEVFGTAGGSFAEYVTTSQDRLAPKPPTLTFEQAAALPVAGFTALQGLRDRAQLRPGERVLIYGAGGGVGTFAVQIARALGARVTAVTSTRNLDLVRRIGADEVIDYTKEDFTRSGRSWDILFDIGADRSLADCRRVLAPKGRHVLAGAPEGLRALLSRLLGAWVASLAGSRRIASFLARTRHGDLMALKDLVESGRLLPVIDRSYPLAEAADAVRYVGTRRARGKVVIRVA